MGIRRFVKINPENNLRRWYVTAWGPTLFGSWAVVRTWGRLGSNWSQCRIEESNTKDEATAEVEAQARQRTKRDYVPSEAKFRRKELVSRIEKAEVKVDA